MKMNLKWEVFDKWNHLAEAGAFRIRVAKIRAELYEYQIRYRNGSVLFTGHCTGGAEKCKQDAEEILTNIYFELKDLFHG